MLKARSVRHLASVSLAVSSLFVGVVATGAGAASLKSHTEQIYDTGIVTSKIRWIFPITDPSYNTVTNVLKFQQPMYRPLVWFGKGSSNAVQWDLSIANAPTVSSNGLVYTVNLKSWKFSDGSAINARSVIFFLNMIKAEAGAWAGYTPGVGYPDKIQSVVQGANAQQVVITMKTAYNSAWYLANALGYITPMPLAWDKTSDGAAAGSGGCGSSTFTSVPAWDDDAWDISASSNCSDVFDYLVSRGSAAALSHFNDDLWQVASGPYKLGSYDPATWTAKLVPNTEYSGPVKAKVSVQFHRYTSTEAFVAALKAGTLDAGGVPTDQLTPSTGLLKAGKPIDSTLRNNFTAYPSFTWGYTFAYYNFNTVSGPALLKQKYIRQALQSAIDQKGIIKSIYNGYGVEGCSVIPAINNPDAPKTCPYKFSVKTAKKYLTDNGWTVPAKAGASTCTKVGGCGAGIAQGSKLVLRFKYLSTPGSQFDSMIAAEISMFANAGIAVTPVPSTEASIFDVCFGGHQNDGSNGDWDICEYGGWQFGAYPSGEGIFVPDAGGNSGDVNDATLTAKAMAAVTGTSKTAMKDFATYGATYLPYLFQPNTFGVALYNKAVKGALPPNSLGDFMPEYITATN